MEIVFFKMDERRNEIKIQLLILCQKEFFVDFFVVL